MGKANFIAYFKEDPVRKLFDFFESKLIAHRTKIFLFVNLLKFLILCGASSAYAASFNCNQSSRPQEKFICHNAEVSKLDDALAKAYRDQLGVLPRGVHSLVQASQRSWLNYWPMSCSSSPTSIKLDANSKECVLDAYRSRIKQLNEYHSIDSRITYQISEYRFIAATTAGEAPSKHTISFSQIIPQSPNDAFINAWLAKDLNKWRSGLDFDSDTEFFLTLVEFGKTILHAVEVQYFFGHGAAHPQTNKAHLYFLPNASRALQPGDFFAGNRWPEVLADFVFKKLQLKLGDNLQVSTAKELIPLIIQPSTWSIFKNSFGIEFNPYEVAPYSEGFVEVEVPLSLIRPYLTPFGKNAFESK
jgi:uncharacterized protein